MPLKSRRRGFTPEQIEAYRRAARSPEGWTLESRLDDVAGTIPEAIQEGAVAGTAVSKPAATTVRKLDLSDTRIGSAIHFAEGRAVLLHDHGGPASVPGLRLRIGKRSATWLYYSDRRIHKHRVIVSESLGSFPEMTTAQARHAAAIMGGRHAARTVPGQRAAVTLAEASKAYLEYLSRRAERRGKPASWAKNAKSLMRHFAPFLNYPLAQLSDAPAAIEKWHHKVTMEHGPVAANQAAKLMRATYRRAARLDRSLPPALPTSAIEYNEEVRSQRALAPRDFPTWRAAWERIATPTRRAHHMVNLLTGCRPGELAGLKWEDVLPAKRCFVIRNAKSRTGIKDIYVPMSAAIARAFKIARAVRTDSPYVFWARDGGHIAKFDCDGLPAYGMDYRRTYRTIAADIEIDELIAHFLLGHTPAGISKGYIQKLILSSGGAMRVSQRRMSQRIEKLLAGK